MKKIRTYKHLDEDTRGMFILPFATHALKQGVQNIGNKTKWTGEVIAGDDIGVPIRIGTQYQARFGMPIQAGDNIFAGCKIVTEKGWASRVVCQKVVYQ